LTEKGIDFESVDYIKESISLSNLKRLLRSAGLKPQEALRKNEAAYKHYVADKNLSDDQLIRVMAEHSGAHPKANRNARLQGSAGKAR
jgi:arsenate reductase-like glutaredoxin family protein